MSGDPRRYTINANPNPAGGGYWFIYDRTLWAECGLPVREDRPSHTHPLRWYWEGDLHGDLAHIAWTDAHRWLSGCFSSWGKVPKANRPHPADVDWEAVQEDLSRAARGQERGEAVIHDHLM